MLRLSSFVFIFCLLQFNITHADTAESLIKKASQALTNQQYSTALIHLKNAAKDHPRDLQVRLELINLFIHTGQGLQAEIEIDKALRLGAKPNQIFVPTAKTHLLLGNFNKVTDEFDFVDLPQEQLAQIRSLQGLAHFNKREFKEARLLFQRAYLLAPNNLDVKLGQSRLYKIDGNVEQERLLVEALLKQNPNHPDVLLAAGEFYRSTNDFNTALNYFNQAGVIQTTNVNVWFGVVRSYIGLRDFTSAQKEIQKVLFSYPEHQVANYLLAVIAFEQNNYTRARSAAEIVLKGDKKNFEALKLLGTIQFHQKDYTNAESSLKKFIKYHPNDVQAKKTLASVYLKRKQGTLALDVLLPINNIQDPIIFSMLANAYQSIGNNDKSTFYLKKALKLSPNNELIKRQHQRTLLDSGKSIDIEFSDHDYNNFYAEGYLPILNYLRQQKYSKVTEILNGYKEVSPNSGFIHYLFGATYLAQEQVEKATQSFELALQLDPKIIEAKLALAKIALTKDDTRRAEKLYREVLKIQANNDQALVSLAGMYHRKGDDKEMLKWLNKSRKNNSASLASREVLVDYYKRNKNFSRAAEISSEMVTIQPENIPLLQKHAENLRANNRIDLAVATYQDIVKLKPNSAAAWFGLGKMQNYEGDIDSAYSSFQRVLKIEPKSMLAKMILVNFDLKREHTNKALSKALSLIKSHPKEAGVYDLLGDVYIAKNMPAKAIPQFKKAVDIEFNSSTYIKLYSSYNINNQTEKGLTLLKQWVKEFPQDMNLKEVLAISYQRKGQYDKAKDLYQQIIQKVRNNDRVFKNLALVTLQNNSPMSMEYADMAYNLNSNSASNLDTLGWVHLKNNNTNEALKYLSQAVKIAPSNPDIRYHYAVALHTANKAELAKAQLALIIKIEGPFLNRQKANELYNTLNQ